MKDILSLKLFTRVARLGSFSAAAREYGLSQSQVSRMVADLEAGLGARLLTRTTRAVVLTEPGAEFLARMEPILIAIEEAEESVREGGELRGLVRMSMPTSFGTRTAIPRLARFAERHPHLHFQFLLGDRRQDLIKDAVDVAFRLGQLPDSSATTKLIATISRVIVASPTYLASHGVPLRPEELEKHRIVGGTAASAPHAWIFAKGDEKIAVAVEPVFSSNENEAAVSAATAGYGITSTSAWACRREISDGALVRVLPEWTLAGIPVHAYFPMGKATRTAARAAVEHLAEGLRRDTASTDL